MIPHPDFARFFNVVKDNPALFGARQENVYRQALPRWTSRPYRFTGVGSVFVGGRWSAKNLTPTVYASTDLRTLFQEANYKYRRYGWAPAQLQPQLQIEMRWELQGVLDLTNTTTLNALDITEDTIVTCDWYADQMAGNEPVTQALARAAFENLAEGLVVPSARRKGGVNIVFYPSHRRDGTVIQTVNEAAIPFMHGL